MGNQVWRTSCSHKGVFVFATLSLLGRDLDNIDF